MTKSKKKKKKGAKKKKTEPAGRMIWLYGPNSHLTREMLFHLFRDEYDQSDQIRELLNLKEDETTIPIFPKSSGLRLKSIQKLRNIKGVTTLIGGLDADFKEDRISELFHGCEVGVVLPSEKQFIDDMRGSGVEMNYQKAVSKKHKLVNTLSDYFKKSDMTTVRYGRR